MGGEFWGAFGGRGGGGVRVMGCGNVGGCGGLGWGMGGHEGVWGGRGGGLWGQLGLWGLWGWGLWDPFNPPPFAPPSLQTSCRRSRITSPGSRAQLRVMGGGGFGGGYGGVLGRIVPILGHFGAVLGAFLCPVAVWGRLGSFCACFGLGSLFGVVLELRFWVVLGSF